MGVKFAREYEDIVAEIATNISEFEAVYDFLGINKEDWDAFSKANKIACVKTLSDDIFYALGEAEEMEVGEECIIYDSMQHRIVFKYVSGAAKTIHLI